METKFYPIFIIILVSIISCNSKKNNDEKPIEINSDLIDFQTSLIFSTDELYALPEDLMRKISGPDFNSETDTIIFDNHQIYISFLATVNGCAKYKGNIEYKGDTIELKLINVRNIECTEERCDRLKYIISNPNNQQYTIIKY